jgi:protein involved in polysaccharide export with SLBB domain
MRYVRRGKKMTSKFYRNLALIFCFSSTLLLGSGAVAQVATIAPVSASDTSFSMDNYVLGPNDKIKISVYSEAGLTGEYVISSDGKVSLPLVGNINASGKTVKQFQDQLVAAYRDGGYLKDPKITAEVVSARPFFILGEVKIPGQYPCLNGMTVMNAVATAGGFTYRAASDQVYIRHAGEAQEHKEKLADTTPVFPGDTIRIDERWF